MTSGSGSYGGRGNNGVTKSMTSRFSSQVSRAMLVFAAALALVLSFVVCVDVIGRLFFDSPLRGTPEMVSSAIVIICFLQLPYAVKSGGMINVDFLVTRLSSRQQALFGAMGAILGAAFFAFLVWGSLDPAVYAWTAGEYEGEGALRVPVWPARFTIVVGASLATLNYLLISMESIAAFRAVRPSSAG